MKAQTRCGRLAGGLLVLVLAGCTSSHYRKSADREAYRAIQAKSPMVTNADPHFTIEQTNNLSLQGFSTVTNVSEFLGPDAERERGAPLLNLRDALALAIQFSRNYQSRKEDLYISALSLTLARHNFAPIFSASAEGSYNVEKVDVLTSVTNLAGEVTLTDHLAEDHSVTASGTIGADWLIRDVGRITTAFTADFLRFFTGDPRAATSSELSATFLRPLLRNGGFKQETEALIQSERQLLYDLRDFTRFRKEFSVQVASAYYGVLENRDTVRNSFLNLQSSQKNAERGRALAQEGRITQSDLGRYEQQALSAESVWINAIRSYKQSLDNFKILLGLNVDTRLVLDDRELAALRIIDPDLSVEDSIRIALAARLDYINSKDELEDAGRKVALAKNFLLPQVDVVASGALESNPTVSKGLPLPDPERYRWNAGLKVDPGLDRKAERNTYRSALIAQDRAARALAQQEDEIKLQVRDSWRTLDQAKRNFAISEIGVKLAERRVEEQNLLAELSRARAQDQVDAQNALIDSKNQLTQALVTHTIARLQFWANMGILYIKDNGQWEEMQHAQAQ